LPATMLQGAPLCFCAGLCCWAVPCVVSDTLVVVNTAARKLLDRCCLLYLCLHNCRPPNVTCFKCN
jgi:hypothetical protein